MQSAIQNDRKERPVLSTKKKKRKKKNKIKTCQTQLGTLWVKKKKVIRPKQKGKDSKKE